MYNNTYIYYSSIVARDSDKGIKRIEKYHMVQYTKYKIYRYQYIDSELPPSLYGYVFKNNIMCIVGVYKV